MEKYGRASSLPPTSLQAESRICELNLSVDDASTNIVRDADPGPLIYTMNNYITCPPEVHKPSVSHSADIPAHSVKLSPSDSSVITDEDSGYFQTNSFSSRRVGSTNSLSTSGQLNYEGSGSFVNRDELLQVMTEDLVEWFIHMYPTQTEELTVENFFDRLSDGILLCHHVTELHQRLSDECELSVKSGRTRLVGMRVGGTQAWLPSRCPMYQTRGLNSANATSAFVSRDNVSNFLAWCRQLGMPDSVLFESEDLVCRKNLRNVAVCLLELARLGGGVGMAVPILVQLEAEIEKELAREEYINGNNMNRSSRSSSCSSLTEQEYVICVRRKSEIPNRSVGVRVDGNLHSPDCVDENRPKTQSNTTARSAEYRWLRNKQSRSGANGVEVTGSRRTEDTVKRKPEIQRPVVDMRSLDEIVRDLLSQCTCKQTFPMIRLSEGRYLFGDKCTQIFVRILRNHVMVRVGGGWDTLSHLLSKYDECRKTNTVNGRTVSDSQCPLNTANSESLLNALEGTDSVAPLPANSPIRGQGKLCAVKKSPPLEECDVETVHCLVGNEQIQSENKDFIKSIQIEGKKQNEMSGAQIHQKKSSGQALVSHVPDKRYSVTNGCAVNSTQMKTPTIGTDRSQSRNPSIGADYKPIRNGHSSSLHHSTNSSSNKILPDRIRPKDIANGTIDKSASKEPYRGKSTNNATAKRTSQARRGLSSAPRTPISNRSRVSSPGRLTSAHSKSSSSLLSCGVSQKYSIPNRQPQTPSVRLPYSEQPDRICKASLPKAHNERTGSNLNKKFNGVRSSTPRREATLPTIRDLNSHKSALIGSPPPSLSKQDSGTSRGGDLSARRVNERKPSLIPRLVRCRSASNIPVVNSFACDTLPDVI